MKIGILDYGSGCNLHSIYSALKILGHKAEIVHTPNDLNIDILVLPGVGSFGRASSKIQEIIPDIKDFAVNRKVLGICLGMQLLSERGSEGADSNGLGLIQGITKKLNSQNTLPHFGWSKVTPLNKSSILLKRIESEKFYFMHSYVVINSESAIAKSIYGQQEFISAVENGNIFGVQFHPENSKDQGLEVFKNLISA